MIGAATCVDDQAYKTAAADQAAAITTQGYMEMALQVAVAGWQRFASGSISNLQIDTAKEQMVMAENIAAHAKKFWPEMAQLADEAFSLSRMHNEYVSLPTAWGAIEVENLNEGRSEWLAEQERIMCISPSRCDDLRWLRNAALLKSDMQNFAARQGERRVITMNDWRYELRTSILAIGLRAQKGYSDFAKLNNSASTSAGKMLADGIQATVGALGYFTTPKPIDLWASDIRKELNTAYAPATVGASTSPVNTQQRSLDFTTPRIAALTADKNPKTVIPKGDYATGDYWSTPFTPRS